MIIWSQIEGISEVNFPGPRYKMSLHFCEEILHLKEMPRWIELSNGETFRNDIFWKLKTFISSFLRCPSLFLIYDQRMIIFQVQKICLIRLKNYIRKMIICNDLFLWWNPVERNVQSFSQSWTVKIKPNVNSALCKMIMKKCSLKIQTKNENVDKNHNQCSLKISTHTYQPWPNAPKFITLWWGLYLHHNSVTLLKLCT